MKNICLLILLSVFAACGNGAKTADTEAQQFASDSIDISEEKSESEKTEDDDDYDYVSEDGRVGVKSGIHSGGGTSPSYWTIWTIIGDNGKKHKMKFEYTSDIRGVHSIQKTDGSAYYIVNKYSRSSTSEGNEWMEAYKIVGDTIREVNVIDGGRKVDNNDFGISFCVPNWYFTTDGYGFDWLLEYDNKTRNLYVPIVDVEKNKNILDRYQVWYFNGERFVCKGEQAHKDMHKSVSKYNRLICYFQTKDYIVRVDSLDSHELRYASWKLPKTMADKPDLIITGGRRKIHRVDPDINGPCDDYRFRHGNYEYIAHYCEQKRTEDGSKHYDHLLVKKGDKVILKQLGE